MWVTEVADAACGMGGAPKGYDAAAYGRDFKAFRAFARQAVPDMVILGPGSVGETDGKWGVAYGRLERLVIYLLFGNQEPLLINWEDSPVAWTCSHRNVSHSPAMTLRGFFVYYTAGYRRLGPPTAVPMTGIAGDGRRTEHACKCVLNEAEMAIGGMTVTGDYGV
jgi:hypothetical protein